MRESMFAAAVLGACHASIATAQVTASSAAEPDTTGQEIVVTAQKRNERLLDVPMSVAAISGDQLTSAGVFSTVNLQQTTPGVVTVNNGFGFLPVIRGIQSTGTSPGDETNVAVYLDDISLGTPLSGFFDLADVERIEVLKGPQGTLYGRNATGGAIKIVTRRPSFDTQGSIGARLRRAIPRVARHRLCHRQACRRHRRILERRGPARARFHQRDRRQ